MRLTAPRGVRQGAGARPDGWCYTGRVQPPRNANWLHRAGPALHCGAVN